MRRLPRWALVAAGVAVGMLVLLVSAWAIDSAITSGHVERSVTLGGRAVGGLSADDLDDVVDDLAKNYDSTGITIETPEGELKTSLGELGVSVDAESTATSTLETGGGGLVLLRPFRWLGGALGEREAPVTFVVDRSQAAATTAALVEANRVDPVEPTLEVTADGLTAVPGTEGHSIDVNGLVDELAARARTSAFSDPITLEPTTVTPAISDDEAEAAAAEANRLTANPLTITVADQAVEVPRETLFGWFRLTTEAGNGARVELDSERVGTFLTESFAALRVEPVDAGYTLTLSGVQITPDAPGQACCTADSTDRIEQALQSGQTAVTLDLEVLAPARDLAKAQALGIVEPVSSFTTNHASGEARVTNIHRIADIVRGAVIEPGATFSLNDYVGRRTRANGFVEAGVIYRGVYESDVGGGVSQFATTTFNAAFFGGLDFGEYQSHSIYISRYPYGREATISFPHPDLQIINNTPYGVMIWTDYTSSSITVSLWSTKSVNADQTGQSESRQGRCTRVTTERTRTWLADGRQETDTVFAVYRPGEGVNC